MTSTTESRQRSSEPIRRAAVITHGKPATIGPALERLEKVAREADVELLLPGEEVEKHGVGEAEHDLTGADIAVVLGGDGTMLRALQRFLGTEIPVLGVNFGRVGFLASVQPNELESGLARVFSGDYRRRALDDAGGRGRGRPRRRRERRRGAQLASRPDGRARVGARRRGHGCPAMRRDDLCEPLRLDCVQPFERRPRVGCAGSTRWSSHSSRRTRSTHARSWCRAGSSWRFATRRPTWTSPCWSTGTR